MSLTVMRISRPASKSYQQKARQAANVLRQESQEFQASLDQILIPCLRKQRNKQSKKKKKSVNPNKMLSFEMDNPVPQPHS